MPEQPLGLFLHQTLVFLKLQVRFAKTLRIYHQANRTDCKFSLECRCFGLSIKPQAREILLLIIVTFFVFFKIIFNC